MSIHAPFLKYFREVANCGSVRMAARHLHISSSAVNRQILKIEDELGVSLFHRTPNGMLLSPAGRVLAEHVNRTLSDAERCLDEIATLAGHTRVPLTIAGQESVIAEFLPPVLMQLHATHPQVGSSFKAAGGQDLTRLLHEHAADVAIMFDAEPGAGTDTLMTRQLPVGAIVSPDHPFASRSQISIKECAEYPLILPDQSWPLRRILDDRLQALSIVPSVLTTSNSIEFLHNMINQQLGIGFQTAVGIERRLLAGELVMVPLHDPEPLYQRLSLCISTNHRTSDVFQFLMSLLLERLGSYADDWS